MRWWPRGVQDSLVLNALLCGRPLLAAVVPLVSLHALTLSGPSAHVVRKTFYDELRRPVEIDETVTSAVTGSTRYTQLNRYDDAHTIERTDRRGVVSLEELDDFDQSFSTTVDTGAGFPTTDGVGRARKLVTKRTHDAGGRVTETTDALSRVTSEVRDGPADPASRSGSRAPKAP